MQCAPLYGIFTYLCPVGRRTGPLGGFSELPKNGKYPRGGFSELPKNRKYPLGGFSEVPKDIKYTFFN